MTSNRLQQFKGLFAQGLLAIVVAAPASMAAIAPSFASSTNYSLKQTNYPIPSDAVFVSPNGKDINTGKTPDSPWTVQRAISQAPVGSTIVFRGGTYRGIDLDIKKRLTLQPYPGEAAWIKGSVEVTGWVADGNTWRKDGWTYSFPQNVTSVHIDPQFPMAGYRDMVFIDGVALKQVATKAEVGPGEFYLDDANDKLYIGNDPNGKTVEATALPEAFMIWHGGTIDVSGTVIRGLGFAHFANTGVNVMAPNITLENNSFIWNGFEGLKFGGKGLSVDAVVRGNTFSYNGTKGVAGSGTHRMLLENNYIGHNNIERFAITWDGAGAKVTHSNDVIWRGNTVENNYSHGLWIDESSVNSQLVNNTVRRNLNAGIIFEVSHKAIIAGNIVHNNGGGIMASNSSSTRVYNNTFSRNGWNLRIKDTTRNNTNQTEFAQGITWISRDHVIKNNIFSNATGNALFEGSNCGTNEHSDRMIAALNYNAYHRTSATRPVNAATWSLGTSSTCARGYTTLANFKSATGKEANGFAIDNVSTNPFFMNESAGDFRLKSDSQAIRRGEALPADVAAAMGLQPGVPVDLGALQSQILLR